MTSQCPKCGYENVVGVDVCGRCAAPLARTCGSCGFKNPTNFRFCGNCGAVLAAPGLRSTSEESRNRLQSSIPPALAEKITEARKQIEGERRTVTVLFADISGFTPLSEKLDPEEVYNLIDSTLKAFIDEIYKHEGTLDKFMGDGVMALFGAPVAHEDDSARAVRAALGMQTALAHINEDLETRLGVPLRVRIGLNSGTVVVGSVGTDLRMDYTALGDTVNVASRLQGVAEPGTILVSRPVYEECKPLFEFRELGTIRVKGRVEPVEIFEAVAIRQKTDRVRGIPGLVAPMVGRAEELARLRRVTDELLSKRRGRIVLVTGEGGIGKSRLTSEFKAYAAGQSVTVLEGVCHSYGQAGLDMFARLLRSYFGIDDEDADSVIRDRVREKVRQTLPSEYAVTQILPYIENLLSVRIVERELAERVRHLEPAQLQQQTFLAIRDLLIAEAEKKPLVVILEDIHWIDKPSLDLLSFLLSAVEHVPIVFYFNSRPAEGPAAPEIERLGHQLYAPQFVPLPLAPLSHADTVALLDLLLTIADLPASLKQMIPERAEGNPFYLEEIIRMLIDRGVIRREAGKWQVAQEADLSDLQVPRTLQALIMTRVDHLSEGPRQALHCAAVIGRDFSYRLLSSVIENSRTLQEDTEELVEHGLVSRIGHTAELEYRFHHLLIQETVYNSLLLRRRERLHHKIAEGIEALFRGRAEEYVEQLAFHYTESKDAERALPYLIRAGERAAGRYANDEALRHYRLAAEFLGKTTPTLEQRTQVYRGLGQVQTLVGDYDGAADSYLLALELLRAGGTAQAPRTSAELMRRIGRVHERRGDYTEALHWLQNALSALERDPHSAKAVERARIYNDIGWVNYRRGQFEEAYQWRMRTLQITEGTDHYNEMASAYNGLVGLFTRQGDWERSTAYAEKGLRLREMIGDTYGVSSSYNNLGSIALEQAKWDEALVHFEQSLAIKQKIGDVEGISRLSTHLGIVYRNKGDYARAVRYSERALEIAEKIKNGATLTLALINLAIVKVLQGDADAAIAHLMRSRAIASEMGYREREAEAQWVLAESRLLVNDLAEAEELASQAVKLASEIGRRLFEGQALRTLGKIARLRRDLGAAQIYLQRSQAIFIEIKEVFELAKTQFEIALVQRDQGCSAEARATLSNAHVTFARLGAEADRALARAELDVLVTLRPAAGGDSSPV